MKHVSIYPPGLPAIPLLRILRQYASAKGKPCDNRPETWARLYINYAAFAAINN